MSLKKIFSYLLLIVFFSILLIVIVSIGGNSSVEKVADEKIVGKGMKYKVFNEQNILSAEITSSSTKRDFDESREPAQRYRTLLTDINGTIFKHGNFKSDINFSGKTGYVENEYKNFLIEGDAKILSDEVTLLSERFFMEGNSLISNKHLTDFSLKKLKGTAKKGIEYHIKIGVINLFRASGTYVRDEKEFHFRCNKLIVQKKKNRIIFKGMAVLSSDDSTMRGREIILRFNEGFKKLNRTDIRGNGYFHTKGEKAGEFREIIGNKIFTFFNDKGKIRKINVIKKGIINLNHQGSKVKAESRLIYLRFYSNQNGLKNIKLMRSGKVVVEGKKSFTVTARRVRVKFNKKGKIENCNTQGESEFKTGEYHGSSKNLSFFPSKNLITLNGNRSIIEKKGNRFRSTKFSVNTKEEKLYSDKEITSTIHLNSGSSIFTESPVFVSSKKIEMEEKKNIIRYIGNVKLFQGETKLTADKVEISNDREIKITGKVTLTFKNGKEEILLSGEKLRIDPDDNRLFITGKGVLREVENTIESDHLDIGFNDNNEISRIIGKKDVVFKRKNLIGKSDNVLWKFSNKVIVFSGNAVLSKKGSGKSSGDEIKFFLNNERVVISSFHGKRLETNMD